MDHQLKELIENLPESPTILTEKNLRRIRALIPVPSDYEILWADILSFGGYPSGLVITEQGLVVKGTRAEVKAINDRSKSDAKHSDKKAKPDKVKVSYRIIPWSLFSLENYTVEPVADGDENKRYIFKLGDESLTQLSSEEFYRLFTSYRSRILEQQAVADQVIESSTLSAINALNVEDVMFNAAYGAGQTRIGHGFYAEEAGAKLDKLHGEQSTVVGRDNAKHGPDKIVAQSPVQCKYCRSAQESVAACFEVDSATGARVYKYTDLSGKPMKLEVPSDQYFDAVSIMKRKILDGQVKGVTDPNQAYDIVRKGRITYQQARNLAKAGRIESLCFDAANGAVTCLSSFGVTSVVTFAQVLWGTGDCKSAAKQALRSGLQVYGLSFAANVLASQLSRTALLNSAKPLAANVGEFLGPKATQAIINAFRALAGKQAIYGAAAQKSFAKFLGSNAITETVVILAFAVPDTYRIIQGRMSKAQYFKNLTSLVGSFLASVGGTALAGAAIGKKFGGSINKTVGKIIGFGAGLLAGEAAGAVVKVIGNCFKEDDAIITGRLFNAVLINCIIDELLTNDEQEELIKRLDSDGDGLKKLQDSLVKSQTQEADIRDYLQPIFESVKSSRINIGEVEELKMAECIDEAIIEDDLDEV